MEFFNPKSNVNFMGIRRVTVWIAIALMTISIISLATRGLNFALDFTGGTLVEVVYDQPVEQADVSGKLQAAGVEGAIVQRFSTTNYSIRLSPEAVERLGADAADLGESSLDGRNAAVGQKILQALAVEGNPVEIKRSEFVGPQVGAELAYNGIVAVFVVLAGILIYIALRFEWKFAVATVVGEIHDVIVTLGFFSLLGLDFDLTVLAAILAVDGYSVNDKIVVFDRVRELFRSTRKAPPTEILNIAVNETLSRTIMTSLTTLLTVVALYVFGGPALEGFSLALIVGIIVGTLSSIFFACPVVLALGVTKQDLLPRAKDEAELARRP
ncbi:protein translocase subunit SecF [Pseudomarimonas salicorniae]|uniref:Protein-export membrane protein SecF n=1 Tax=Pseudomarimonas salicorniae TaxID=2933270 RepID=A0ABT0GGL6_9GAMM|nr:protein translocase subunit SecF [Lysobacter sp. CAU 1642]MCK7593696.1 protein translocase subunit SecF [Lysobacter sp. CAU 1642]